MNQNTKYYFLVSDVMSKYTLNDIKNNKNVRIINKAKLPLKRILALACKLHLSLKVNRSFDLPLKKLWYLILLNKSTERSVFVISPSWYNKQLVSYIRKHFPNSKIVLFFHDIVAKDLKYNKQLRMTEAKSLLDNIVVYNKDDAEKYQVIYHSTGYSPLHKNELKKYPQIDVVFIGAAKNRLSDIRKAYQIFRKKQLQCYFYVMGFDEKDRIDDGINYGDKFLSYDECLALENSARCLFEIVQEGSSGRTYRLMDAVIYNKILLTNCPEILTLDYYKTGNVIYYQKVDDLEYKKIDVRTITKYNYDGEFSNVKFIEFIEKCTKE